MFCLVSQVLINILVCSCYLDCRPTGVLSTLPHLLHSHCTPIFQPETTHANLFCGLHLQTEPSECEALSFDIDSVGSYAPEVPLSVFFDKIVPRTEMTEEKVSDIFSRALDDPTVYNRAGKRWVAFPDDPKQASGEATEEVVFSGIAVIMSAIEAAARFCAPELEPRTSFHNMSAISSEPSARATRTCPNAEFRRVRDCAHPDGNAGWVDVAVTGEYRKSSHSTMAMNDVSLSRS